MSLLKSGLVFISTWVAGCLCTCIIDPAPGVPIKGLDMYVVYLQALAYFNYSAMHVFDFLVGPSLLSSSIKVPATSLMLLQAHRSHTVL